MAAINFPTTDITALLTDATQVSPDAIIFAGYDSELFGFTDLIATPAGVPYDITSWTITNIQYATGQTNATASAWMTQSPWLNGGTSNNVQVTKVAPNTSGLILVQVAAAINQAPTRSTPFAANPGYGVVLVRFTLGATISGVPFTKNRVYSVVSTAL